MVPLATKKFDTIQKYKTKKTNMSLRHQSVQIQDQAHNTDIHTDAEVEDALKDFMQMRVLETVYEEDERSWDSPNQIQDLELAQPVSLSTTDQSASFRKLLESTPNHLVQTKNLQKIRKTTLTENVSDFFKYFAKSTFSPVSILYAILSSNLILAHFMSKALFSLIIPWKISYGDDLVIS